MVMPTVRRPVKSNRCVRDALMILVGAAIGGYMSVFFAAQDAPTPSMLQVSDIATSRIDSSSKARLATESLSSTLASSPLYDGFKPLHVYYGQDDLLLNQIPDKWRLKDSPRHQNGKQWFGQHGQDVAVMKFLNFTSGGFFVDLAANDAVWASNTFAMERNFGWKGICIEPNPYYWFNHAFRANCHMVGAIVGPQKNEEVKVVLPYQKGQGPFGGVVGKEFDQHNMKNAVPRYTVPLEDILQLFDAPQVIDYLSLDVEGAETFILRKFPFDKYQFKVMTVERPKPELQEILAKNKYQKVMDMKKGDSLWAHKDFYALKQNLQHNPQDIDNHSVEGMPN